MFNTLINRVLVNVQWSNLGHLAKNTDKTERYYLIEHNRREHYALLSLLPNQYRPIDNQHILFAYSDGITTLREQLLDLATKQQLGHNIEIIPIAIYHGRMPQKSSSLASSMLAESWAPLTSFNRILQILLYGRQTLAQIGLPLYLKDICHSNEPTLISQKASRVLKTHFNIRRKSVVGPDLSHRRLIIDLVHKSPMVQVQINKQLSEGKLASAIDQHCKEQLHQIAANFNPHTTAFISKLLDWLWPKLYSDIKITGIGKVKQQALGQQLVFLPCHRSHLDYVLLSWALHKQGLMLPHVAAGENLNIPVIGPILKQGGAIFMRRSFKGDPIYPVLYQSYLAQMSKLGHSLEYYIEGGRSRTGRLLPPKKGLLSMTLENYHIDPSQPVCLIPVWIGYDRLPESSSYSKELSGGSKAPETLKNALRSIRRLKQHYGEAHINFGEPLRLDTMDMNQPTSIRTESTALEVMQRINAAATPTRSALLGTVLLNMRNDTLDTHHCSLIVDQLGLLIQSFDPNHTFTTSKNWFDEFSDMGLIQQQGREITLTGNQRLELSFYRNHIQHMIIIPALIILLLQRLQGATTLKLNRILSALYPYLQAELYLPCQTQQKQLCQRWLHSLASQGLIKKHATTWQLCSKPICAVLAHCGEPILARYYLVICLIEQNGQMEYQELINESSKLALELHKDFGFHSPEYGASPLYQSFIDCLINQKILSKQQHYISANTNLTRLLKPAKLILLPQLQQRISHLVNQH